MSQTPDNCILTLSNTQARDLAGSLLIVGEESYRFRDYDPAHPGQPPWRSGAEGKAFPLLSPEGEVAAYLKFFARPTQKRLDRTAWLLGQRMHTWSPGLTAAPLLWADTRKGRQSTNTGFHFAGYLAQAVPGETWLELKNHIAETGMAFSEDLRWRCVNDLLLATAVLEQAGMVHGDLSPNNIVIDLEAPPDEPALYLIDFDAFVTEAAGANRAVNVAEGGTYGTEGYCPPELPARANEGDGSVAPYSDRYGRDMLLLELLFMDRGLSADDAPATWRGERLDRRYSAWRARCDPACWQTLQHLEPLTVFSLAEQERPASAELAAALGLSLPAPPTVFPAVSLWDSPPAVLGHRAAVPQDKRSRQPGKPALTYRRFAPPGQATTPSRPRVKRPPKPSADPNEYMKVLLAISALFGVLYGLVALVGWLVEWVGSVLLGK